MWGWRAIFPRTANGASSAPSATAPRQEPSRRSSGHSSPTGTVKRCRCRATVVSRCRGEISSPWCSTACPSKWSPSTTHPSQRASGRCPFPAALLRGDRQGARLRRRRASGGRVGDPRGGARAAHRGFEGPSPASRTRSGGRGDGPGRPVGSSEDRCRSGGLIGTVRQQDRGGGETGRVIRMA